MAKNGTVKWFNDRKGYGFINIEENPNEDIFVHYSNIDEEGYRKLAEGQSVEFEYVLTERGPVANHVKKIEKESK